MPDALLLPEAAPTSRVPLVAGDAPVEACLQCAMPLASVAYTLFVIVFAVVIVFGEAVADAGLS